MRRVLAYALAWTALAVAFGLLAGSVNVPEFRLLAREGIETRGVVRALEPTNHQQVRYSYQANGITYTGIGGGGYGNPPFEQLSPGDSVIVYYAARNPTTSVLGEPQERLNNEISGITVLVLLFPTVIVLRFASKLRGSKR